MKVAKTVSLTFLSIAILGTLVGYALCSGPIDLDLLWTTNAVGTSEINEFLIGDPVYLRTNPGKSYPLPQISRFRVYIFEGNFVLENGDLIPGGRPTFGLTPLDVDTDSNGQFGPTLIWDSAMFGEYTIVLDCIIHSGYPAGTVGVYDQNEDYREDLCTANPTPPSFHVIPELGTVALLASMLGSLGYFAVRRKRNQKHA